MANGQKVQEIYVDLVARTAAFKVALDDATSQTRKFSQQMKAEMAESRGAIRLVSQELGVGMPRALQGFVAQLPGVATAMSAAFNAIAVLALIDIVVKAGIKIEEFAAKNQEAARKNAEAWKNINAPLVESNDELQVVNDKLANSIAKLEHKPHNGIKEAIDEAVVSADKLSNKLDQDLSKIQDALKGQSVGFVKTLFGQASTSDIETKYADLHSRISEANTTGNANIRAARDSGDPAKLDAAKKALDTQLTGLYAEGSKFASNVLSTALIARKAQEDWAKGGAAAYSHPVSERSGFNSQDMGARIQAASGLLNFFGGQQDALNLTSTNDDLTKRNDALTAAKDNADEVKKADADRLRAFETAYQLEKSQYGMSLSQEAAYWNSKLSSFTKGSEQYLAVLTRFATAAQAEGKYLSTVTRDYNARSAAAPGLSSDRGVDQYNQAVLRGLEQQSALRASLEETRTAFNLATGAITPHQAALDMASAHAGDYADKLKALQVELSRLQGEQFTDANGNNLDPENAAKQQNIQNAISDVTAKAKLQQIIDLQATLSTTWTGMVDSVFDELVRKSQDTVGQLKQISEQIIDGLNTQFAKALTGQHTNFKQVLEGGAESLAKSGLQKIEGIGLSALGFSGGKRDGSSAASALFVEMSTGGAPTGISGFTSIFGSTRPNVTGPSGEVAGIASSASKGLLGLLNNSNWASSLMGGKLFGAGSIFGHFALGGDVMAGVPIDVGELGHEKFVPSVPGRIIPNNQLGGGDHWHIDARGTDPALSQANFQRALAATHAQSVRDASRATAERNRRIPH